MQMAYRFAKPSRFGPFTHSAARGVRQSAQRDAKCDCRSASWELAAHSRRAYAALVDKPWNGRDRNPKGIGDLNRELDVLPADKQAEVESTLQS